MTEESMTLETKKVLTRTRVDSDGRSFLVEIANTWFPYRVAEGETDPIVEVSILSYETETPYLKPFSLAQWCAIDAAVRYALNQFGRLDCADGSYIWQGQRHDSIP